MKSLFRQLSTPLILAGLIAHFFPGACFTVQAEDANQPDVIPLWKDEAPTGKGAPEKSDASITLFRPSKPDGTAVLICPGGGYGRLVSGPEGNGIALWLNQHGVTGIVLKYRLPRGRQEVPLLDAQQALRLVRQHNTDWNLNITHLGIMGFSAGGHLASTVGTHFQESTGDNTRPDFMVLVYPVISMGDITHQGSKASLLGATPAESDVLLFSNEKQVTDRTPPAFLAHAKDDTVVSPENSRLFYEALQQHGIASKYLVLERGGHGLSGYKGPSWDAWQASCLEWMASQGFLPKENP